MLVGRDEERRRILDAVSAGKGVVVAGPPGVGRTGLLRDLQSTLTGARLVAGASTQADRPLLPASWAVREWPPAGPADAVAAADWVREQLGGDLLLCDDLAEADPATAATVVELVRQGGRLVAAVTTRRQDTGADGLVELLVEAGAVDVRLSPLGLAEAAAMAAKVGAPDSGEVALASGGYPAAVVALAAGAPVPASIAAEVADVVRSLPTASRRSLALLALCDGPVPGEIPGSDALVTEGLAVCGPDGWMGRSRVAASASLEGFTGGERAALHVEAASRVADPVAAVRHLLAAGDDAGADRYAERAAKDAADPGVAARLWSMLAARSRLDEHRLAAARAAIRAADGALAATALGASDPGDPETHLIAAQAARLAGDEVGALERLASSAGGAAAGERARLLVTTAWRRPEPPVLDGAPASLLVAALSDALGSDGKDGDFGAVADAARAAADRDVELSATAAATLQALVTGSPERARQALADLERRVTDTGAPSWAEVPARLAAVIALHVDGDPRPAIGLVDARVPLSPAVAANAAYALAQVGRVGEAAVLLDDTPWPSTPIAEALRSWAAAEVAEVGARRTTCHAAAARCVQASPEGLPLAALAELSAARADVDAGRPMTASGSDGGALRLAISAERAALSSGRQGAETARAFELAAEAWEGRSEISRLRCLWAAADAVGAIPSLESLEETALGLELHPLVARVRRSLRAAGVRRSASASDRRGVLSAREREVLLLVRKGLASPEIAARLGVARSTIESQIKSAVRKLGARTRVHAASMLEVDA